MKIMSNRLKYEKHYRFIKVIKIDDEWHVQNRFYENVTIGNIKWSPFSGGGCYPVSPSWVYYPVAAYWHRTIALSVINIQDILKAIRYVEKIEKDDNSNKHT